MIRKIIKINEDECDGCGLCATACHEGAIGIINGKAKLLRDDYCDGLGNCLPVCPTGAITFEEREALPFDEEAVEKKMKRFVRKEKENDSLACGCPSAHSKVIEHKEEKQVEVENVEVNLRSRLNQWPVQIKLVPVNAPYFKDANLLIAADCTAYAYANFHNKFMKNKITLIGCPKLDEGDYADKLTEILNRNNIKSLTVVRMEVPCCGGIVNAVIKALKNSGKMIPWQVVTLSADGEILD